MVGLRATSSAVAALLVLLFLAAQARGSAPASGIQGQENLTLLPAALTPAAGDLPPSRACSSAPSCTDPAGRSLEAWLRWVGSSVSSFWASEFLNADGPDWRPARQLLVARGVTFRSHCDGGTTVRTSSSPSYCALDGATGTVYLPLGALRRHIVLPYGNFHHRDFVLSFIVAHEWAHHLQAFLGLSGPVQSIELQADCLAGVWAFTIWPPSLISAADVGEAVILLEEAGFSRGGVDVAHGTRAQRRYWFTRGLKSGRPGRCVVPT